MKSQDFHSKQYLHINLPKIEKTVIDINMSIKYFKRNDIILDRT
jgi:hypothetical protein